MRTWWWMWRTQRRQWPRLLGRGHLRLRHPTKVLGARVLSEKEPRRGLERFPFLGDCKRNRPLGHRSSEGTSNGH